MGEKALGGGKRKANFPFTIYHFSFVIGETVD